MQDTAHTGSQSKPTVTPPAGPCAMVIFGAGGDLTKRLVIPALYNLVTSKLLPDKFALIGVDLAELDDQKWCDEIGSTLEGFVHNLSSEFDPDKIDKKAWKFLSDRMSYVRGDLNSADTYKQVGKQIEQVTKDQGTEGNCLFYLAVADRFFGTIVEQLGKAGLTDEGGEGDARKYWRRVIIEKPFGHDLASAKALNAEVLSVLNEQQTYRIDHFLGKETVQNILALRFANGLFEPVWNRDHIDHVQITVSETLGVELRGRFYEKTGALRDMVPNHVFQLLAMTAMEAPTSFDADMIRGKKAEVFSAIREVSPGDFVRGQYAEGIIAGQPVQAYTSEPDVAPDSEIETYVAMKLGIDNWRWAGVPFYLRTGKRMARRTTEIAIRFKQAPFTPFQRTGLVEPAPNWLVLQIQPDEGISLQFDAKRPGPTMDLAPVRMEFKYKDWFPNKPSVGYETLIYDCMIGDQTLFQRADQVEGGWRVVQPILDYWVEARDEIPAYMSGAAGPAAADLLLAKDGREWRPITPPRPPAKPKSEPHDG